MKMEMKMAMEMESKTKTVTLSDGRHATLRPPKGRDLIRAHDVAGGENKYKFTCALLAQVTTIDRAPCVYEDIVALYAADIDKLALAAGSDFLSSTGKSSPDLSNGASDLPN